MGGAWWASVLYTVTPNWQLFWLADALDAGQEHLPLGLRGQGVCLYGGYVGAVLAAAVLLFRGTGTELDFSWNEAYRRTGWSTCWRCWPWAWRAWPWRAMPTRWPARSSIVFLGLGVLVAAVSWFQMRLEESERLEKLELDELAKTHGGVGAVRGQGRGGVPGAALARAVRAVLRAGVHGAAVPAAGRRAPGCCGAGCRAARRMAEVKQPISGPGAVCACSAWCCSCWAGFPPPSRGWNTTGCCGPAPATCCSTPFLCLVVALGMVGV